MLPLNINSLNGFIERFALEDCFRLDEDDDMIGKSKELPLIPPPCGDTNCSLPSGKGAKGRP